MSVPGAYPRFKKWGTNRGQREERGAKGAEGWVCGGSSLSPPGGLWAMLPAGNFFRSFELKMADYMSIPTLMLIAQAFFLLERAKTGRRN